MAGIEAEGRDDVAVGRELILESGELAHLSHNNNAQQQQTNNIQHNNSATESSGSNNSNQ